MSGDPMSTLNINGRAKCGVHRRGSRVLIALEFPDHYAAMAAFETFSREHLELRHDGPKKLTDSDIEIEGIRLWP